MNTNIYDFQNQIETANSNKRWSKIVETVQKPQIIETYKDIQNIIEKMNDNVGKIFQRKEQQLISHYKGEMEHAQNQLDQLNELTSDKQLNLKLQQKKEELEKKRQEKLFSTLSFSNKCQSHKEKLAIIINTTKDLDSEVQFLDQQIEFSRNHNQKLKERLALLKQNHKSVDLDQVIKQKVKSVPTLLKTARTQKPSVEPRAENIQKEIMELRRVLERKQNVLEQLEKIKNDGSLQENQLEKIFIECVDKVKKEKKKTDLHNLAMQSKRPRERPQFQTYRIEQGLKPIRFTQEISRLEDLQYQQSFEERIQEQDHFFSDLELNEQHKRQIFEEFVSRLEVKILIYNLLFQNGKLNSSLF